ncbi:MAG TPA: undecaprenyl-diphosphatase UppP [Gemmatimonadaceae bacterium]|jgi:undecaprenyl-diphosphatase|nr:undecaprenyl-diphosphatase UppP [Gemmatimonadaceae bacterium]
MTVFQAVVLGTLQGLAEFLPISSSAHLSLAPWFLGWEDPGLGFDVALHVGTLVALLWYFRREWIDLAGAAISIVRNRRVQTVEEKRVVLLVIATIPAGIAGLLLEDYAETVFRAPMITAVALVVLGLLLWVVDLKASSHRSLDRVTPRDALLVGLAQCLALVPGVSRSGATITAGRALSLDRQSAAVFSFLMSMPIIAAAAIFKVPDAIRETGVNAPLVAGVLAAAVSSWLAIAVLLKYVSRHNYAVFAIYRIVLGVAVILLLNARG